MNDRALLRDLKAAFEQTEGQDAAARQQAIQAVMEAHGATEQDVARLLHRARSQHHGQLQGLAQRLNSLITNREEEQSTVAAVEQFLHNADRHP